mmetsp:Transcript_41868/g.65418  ORF Transcript_41868/g.65418 Transcript_41868/m.65418 type:complete len:144 (-) Transcript_41868:398-829(-)
MGSIDRLVLEREDSELFITPRWLNDNCLEFWLEHVYYDCLETPESVLFMSPAALHMTKFLPQSDLSQALEQLQLKTKGLVIMPVNDNSGAEAGGSHWAFVAYLRSSNVFRYYDSAGKSNWHVAKSTSETMSDPLGAPPGMSWI